MPRRRVQRAAAGGDAAMPRRGLAPSSLSFSDISGRAACLYYRAGQEGEGVERVSDAAQPPLDGARFG